MTGSGPVVNIMDLLPELLEKIFDFLEDSNDFLAVITTCQQWHDIIAYRKSERLFPKVIQILRKQEPPFPLESMLKTRQVSRKWKRETDNQLTRDMIDRQKYRFQTSEEMNVFMTHVNTLLPPESNPFVGNHVTILTADPGLYQPFLQLIRQYGNHLRRAVLGFYLQNFSQNELKALLNHLPNLELLTIEGFLSNWSDDDAEFDTILWPALPRLTNLLWLFMERVADWNLEEQQDERYQNFISSFVTAYGPQLETLKSSVQLLRIQGITDFLPNLTRLSFEMQPPQTFTLEDLQVFSQVEWRLETLNISGIFVEPSAEFLGVLNHFSGTLSTLNFSVDIEHDFDPRALVTFSCLKQVGLKIRSRLWIIPDEVMTRLTHLVGVAPNLEKLELENHGLPALNDANLDSEMIKSMFRKMKKFKLTHRF